MVTSIEVLQLLLALLLAMLVATCTFAAITALREPGASWYFDALFDPARRVEVSQTRLDTILLATAPPRRRTWTGFWHDLAVSAGARPERRSGPARSVLILAIATAGVVLAVSANALAAAAGLIAAPGVRLLIYQRRADRRRVQVEDQLPELVVALRAHIADQSTDINTAIRNCVNDLPTPLRDEMAQVRADLLVQVPLADALARLTTRVNSREVEFLRAALLLSEQGRTDPVPLLRTVGAIAAMRMELRGKLRAKKASFLTTLRATRVAAPVGLALLLGLQPDNLAIFVGQPRGVVLLVAAGLLVVVAWLSSARIQRTVERLDRPTRRFHRPVAEPPATHGQPSRS